MNKYIFFWGMSDVYSNFHPSKFEYDNQLFVCSEQAFMYEKAKYFGDTEIMKEILDFTKYSELFRLFVKGAITRNDILVNTKLKYQWTAEVNKIKQLGRKVKNYTDKWDSVRYNIMVEILKAKFSANLKSYILQDGKFVEASPYDRIWGIGLSQYDAEQTPEKFWKGQNLLGKALSEVRQYYKEQQ